MENSKLLLLAKKLSKRADEKFKLTYQTFIHSHLYELIKEMSARDVIYLVIISSLIKRGSNINEKDLIDFIDSKIFGFSLVEKESDEIDSTCNNCAGDGELSCGECGGDGNSTCDDCDGSGEDSEGYTCNTCDGDGDLNCSTCDGVGTESCDYCDGTGEVTDTDSCKITQSYYVSIDDKLFSILETKDEEDILNHSFVYDIDANDNTFIFSIENEEISKMGVFDDMSVNDIIFYQLVRQINFYGEGARIFSDLASV